MGLGKERKLLAVFSTCGISGHENIAHYADALRSLIYQDYKEKYSPEYKIAVSGCRMSEGTKLWLQAYFQDYISFNWIDEVLPLSVTFNHTVEMMVKKFGEFENYLYIDSGISFWDPVPHRSCPTCGTKQSYDALRKLMEVHSAGPNAITAAFPSNDDGHEWWGIEYKEGEDYVYPLGKATNMHCQLFTNEWKTAFKRILPDIFASNCMESCFQLMAGSLHKRYQITQKVHLQHQHSMDGASIGFREERVDVNPMSSLHPSAGFLFRTKKTMDERYEEGHEFGFGFEQCKDNWLSDPSKFDKDGYALDPRLKTFLARELYLSKEEFDYDKINSIFVPGAD